MDRNEGTRTKAGRHIARCVVLGLLLGACSAPNHSGGEFADGLPPLQLERLGGLQHVLEPERFARGYPAVVERLKSQDPEERCIALRTIAASDELDALPLVVAVMFATEDRGERAFAASALSALVARHELERRDPDRPTGVFLLPRTEEHLDLRPLAGVVEEMLASDDSAVQGAAATMIGYIGLVSLADRLAELRHSQHPAIQHAVEYAFALLEDSGGTTFSPLDALGQGAPQAFR